MTSHTRVVNDYVGSGAGSTPLEFSDPEILRLHKEILSGAATDWMVIGYDGDRDKLIVVGSGSGGLEELKEELSDGAVQYCFLRFKHARGTKFALICWVGEGVPAIRKGVVTKHVHEVESVLKGFSTVLNVRREEELDSEQIERRLFR